MEIIKSNDTREMNTKGVYMNYRTMELRDRKKQEGEKRGKKVTVQYCGTNFHKSWIHV